MLAVQRLGHACRGRAAVLGIPYRGPLSAANFSVAALVAANLEPVRGRACSAAPCFFAFRAAFICSIFAFSSLLTMTILSCSFGASFLTPNVLFRKPSGLI